ncbi:MAG: 4,5-dihydroxyphthalate decarboxylase [Firmicutes bacterium]|nr:4,5-dihydroxyphthalate decarboxylase [Bacillota bacterium]
MTGRYPDGPLVMALAHYDRHVPFFEGAVIVGAEPLRVLEVGQNEPGRWGRGRHERMLRHQEFDVAEVSLSSYLMAKDRGQPFLAIPVFPRRLFSLSQIWVRRDGAIRHPRDLVGRRVGLNTFQTTLSVLAKADLKRVFDIDWRHITWVVAREETIAFQPPQGCRIESLPEGMRLHQALKSGLIDAVIVPHPSPAMLSDPEVGRLLDDPVAHEQAYFREHGYWPIMHVVVFREAVLQARPDLARQVFTAFEEAFSLCQARWQDPNWSWLAFGRHAFEAQRRELSAEVWRNGLSANRPNLEWFLAQSRDQGLIDRLDSVEALFHPSTWDT